MNKTLLLTTLLCFLSITPCRADLQLDTSMTSKQVYNILKPSIETVIKPYGDLHQTRIGIRKDGSTISADSDVLFGPSRFLWKFNDRKYLTTVATFVPEAAQEDLPQECVHDKEDSLCENFLERYRVYHLFVFDEQHLDTLAAVTPLHIKRSSRLGGLPSSGEVKAMAAAREVPDALLITATYSDNLVIARWTPSQPEPYGYPITLLFRWSEENGQLKIEQDDSCLGNPNAIATIAEARKKLRWCKEHPGQRDVNAREIAEPPNELYRVLFDFTGMSKEDGPDGVAAQEPPVVGSKYKIMQGNVILGEGRLDSNFKTTRVITENPRTLECWIADKNGIYHPSNYTQPAMEPKSMPQKFVDKWYKEHSDKEGNVIYGVIFDFGLFLKESPKLVGKTYTIYQGENNIVAQGRLGSTGLTPQVTTKYPDTIECILDDDWSYSPGAKQVRALPNNKAKK